MMFNIILNLFCLYLEWIYDYRRLFCNFPFFFSVSVWFLYQGYACVIKSYEIVPNTLKRSYECYFFFKCLEFIIKVIWAWDFFCFLEVLNTGFSFFGYWAINIFCFILSLWSLSGYLRNLLVSSKLSNLLV